VVTTVIFIYKNFGERLFHTKILGTRDYGYTEIHFRSLMVKIDIMQVLYKKSTVEQARTLEVHPILCLSSTMPLVRTEQIGPSWQFYDISGLLRPPMDNLRLDIVNIFPWQCPIKI